MTNLTGTTAVTFGAIAATSYLVNSPTQITAITPASAAGAVNVAVTTVGGIATGINAYTYALGPTFISIAPVSGLILGGNSVVITGTNLTGASTVTFGGAAATGLSVVNDSSLTAVTPAHVAGLAVVVVTTPNGTATGTYTHVAPVPTFTSIAPVSGSTNGGTLVTITGTGLTAATAVTFEGVAATSVVVVNDTSITATSPLHASGVVNVNVTTAGGVAAGTGKYTYVVLVPSVNLGIANNFVILAKTGISTTGTTLITGDIGVSPAAATYMTGFGLVADATNQFSTSPQIVGRAYAANYADPTPATMTTAISNMETAYTDAAGRTLPDATELYAGNLGGKTLTPGLYKWSTGVLIPTSTDLTLDAQGNADAVWIFQIAQDLTMDSASRVVLTNGAKAENVYWQIAGPAGAIIGPGAHAQGTLLTQKAITMDSGATLDGKALAQTAVTLIANRINGPIPTPVIVVPSDVRPSGGSDTYPNAPLGSSDYVASPELNVQLAPTQQPVPVAGSGVTPIYGTGTLVSNPLSADIVDMPGVAVSWNTQINEYSASTDARITTVILQKVDASILNAFATALHNVGLELGNLAYVMIAQKTGVTPTGPATVTMTASQNWVTQNGGMDAIRIIAISDDGVTEVLTPSFAGYDRDSGYLTFKATTSHSLWITGLVAVTPYTPGAPVSGQAPKGQMAPPQTQGDSAIPGTSTGMPIMLVGGILAALAIIGIALMVYIRRNK